MPGRLRLNAANALTASRVLLAPALVALIWQADAQRIWGVLAVVVFGAVAASDVWDGRLARRLGTESSAGQVFDHFADIGFILVALSAYALHGDVPWWVPAAVGASFAIYVWDSWSRPMVRGGLIGSRIGHAAGVLNYSLIGVLVCNNSAGIHLLSGGLLSVLFWLVPIYSGLAAGARLAGRGTAPATEVAATRCTKSACAD
jgi:phosphatidylglycerophosphate synthase